LTDLRITSVYYPVTTPDHAALHQLLDALECYDPAMVDQIAARSIGMTVPPDWNMPG
jgi:hypothetical protein